MDIIIKINAVGRPRAIHRKKEECPNIVVVANCVSVSFLKRSSQIRNSDVKEVCGKNINPVRTQRWGQEESYKFGSALNLDFG